MVEMEITVQGRFTKFPGKEAVITKLRNGLEVKLRVEKDYNDQIILVDCITDEPAGCIPPNPSYLDKYERLRKVVDGGNSRWIQVDALEPCAHYHHYRAKIMVPEEG